jgi:hypothetical protein
VFKPMTQRELELDEVEEIHGGRVKILRNMTTNLAAIHEEPDRFSWGRVRAIHDVGTFTIVEFNRRPLREGEADTDPAKGLSADTASEAIRFYVYVEGRPTASSTDSFEEALILALAFKGAKMDPNAARWAALYAAKMLGF